MGAASTAAELDPHGQPAAQAGSSSGLAGSEASANSVTAALQSGEPKTDILLQVPACEVHRIRGEQNSVAARGSLVIYGVIYPNSSDARMALEVDQTRCWLLADTATLKVAPMSYMLALPDGKEYLLITFAEDTLPEAIGAFEGLLEEVTMYAKSETLLSDPALEQGEMAISEGLTFTNKGAKALHNLSCKVAGGILLAADAASKKMLERQSQVVNGSEPAANPRQLPGFIKAGASFTRSGTKLVARTAGGLVNAAATVPVWVVNRFTGGGGGGKPGEPPKPQGATKQMVTASAVSFTLVYESMEQGAKTVLLGARESASGIIGHKYGPDAGKFANDTLASTGHMANAYTSYRNIAVRAIAKKTAKTTAKRMLYAYMGKNPGQPELDPKAAARANVQRKAKSMRQPNTAPANPHQAMLQSHSSFSAAGGRSASMQSNPGTTHAAAQPKVV